MFTSNKHLEIYIHGEFHGWDDDENGYKSWWWWVSYNDSDSSIQIAQWIGEHTGLDKKKEVQA